MTTTTLITAQTAAAEADVTVAAGDVIQVWVDQELSEGEKVGLYLTDGASAEIVIKGPGSEPSELDKDQTCTALIGPATFRVKKSATAQNVAVLYNS